MKKKDVREVDRKKDACTANANTCFKKINILQFPYFFK